MQEPVKIYLDEESSGVLICPKCGTSKQFNFAGNSTLRSALVKCRCRNSFPVQFEKRQWYRKKLDVYGDFFEADSPFGNNTLVKVVDISIDGVHLLNLGHEVLQTNRTIKLSFPLGGRLLNCSVIILRAQNNHVGGKIINIDEHAKKILGFFLLP